MNSLRNKSIFITGATGSFGTKYIEKILGLQTFERIVIYSRDEYKQYLLKNKLNKHKSFYKLRFFIGDIRDKDRLRLALNNVDYVIHAAALKQVDTLEYNPFEAVKTNVIGTENLIEVSLEKNVKKFLALSTDKSVEPANLYGGTKFVSEKLVLAANNYKGSSKCLFSCVRYGNVFGSRGSVVPLFIEQNKKNNYFTITHKDMTRFSLTLKQSVDFVNLCLNEMKGNEIFIPKLFSYKITDIAKAINPLKKIKIVGLRPAEKLEEVLISLEEINQCVEYNKFYVVYNSTINIKNLKNKYKSKKVKLSLANEYNSKNNSHYLSQNELIKLVDEYERDI